MRKTKIYLAACVSLLLFWATASEAQIVSGEKMFVTFGIYSQSWKLKSLTNTVKLNQWVFPVSCFLPLTDNYELRIISAAASAGFDNIGEKKNLNGLNDTRIEVSGSFFDDRYLVSLGINLPTGKKSLNRDETEVAQHLSLSYLSLPVKNFGEGLNLNLTFTRAFEWKNLVLGAGAGYQYNGPYDPYYSLSDYKPGDKLYLTGGVTSNLNKMKLMMDLTHIRYQADKQGREKIFKKGDQCDIKGAFHYDRRPYSLALKARFIVRARDEWFGVAKVYLEELRNHGDDFRFSTSFSYRARQKVTLIGQVETKLIGKNDYEGSSPLHLGASHIVGFSGGFSYEFRDGYSYSLLAGVFQGRADGDDFDLSGFQLQSSLFVTF
jgi:hypothetical protein